MILISPYAKQLRNDKENPKNYPYWKELISLIQEPIIQVGIDGEEQLVENFENNLTISQLSSLIHECRIWISVDSFFQHLAWDLGKPGIVLWGQSDPNIFGHPENINLLRDRKYLRKKQFWLWEQTPYIKECFVDPAEVIKHI
jgi:ADP-heptose:LPS heptosyltransferase